MSMKDADVEVRECSLTRREGGYLYLYVYHTPPQSEGLSRKFTSVLEKLEDVGYMITENFEGVNHAKVDDPFVIKFTRHELGAIARALQPRLQPGSQLCLSIGAQRGIVKPLAKSLGIHEEIMKKLQKEKDSDEIEVKFDDEVEKERKEEEEAKKNNEEKVDESNA